MTEDMRALLDRYEARGDEAVFALVRPQYEQAIADAPDAEVVRDYGYLLECHGRYALRAAVTHYEQAIELDPAADKTRYQLISARAALGESDVEVARYRTQLVASPTDVRTHRLLAAAHLAARDYQEAGRVVDAGLQLAGDDRRLVEYRGEVRAATGDVEGALADWRFALGLDPEDISVSTRWPSCSNARVEWTRRSPPGRRSGTGPRPGDTPWTPNGLPENSTGSAVSKAQSERAPRLSL